MEKIDFYTEYKELQEKVKQAIIELMTSHSVIELKNLHLCSPEMQERLDLPENTVRASIEDVYLYADDDDQGGAREVILSRVRLVPGYKDSFDLEIKGQDYHFGIGKPEDEYPVNNEDAGSYMDIYSFLFDFFKEIDEGRLSISPYKSTDIKKIFTETVWRQSHWAVRLDEKNNEFILLHSSNFSFSIDAEGSLSDLTDRIHDYMNTLSNEMESLDLNNDKDKATYKKSDTIVRSLEILHESLSKFSKFA